MKISDEYSPSPDELDQQAWAWLRRLNSGEVKQWDAVVFKQWLGSSPAHQAAFSAARLRWQHLKSASGEVLRANPKAAADRARALGEPHLGRRYFLRAAICTAAVAGVAVLYPEARGLLTLDPNEWGADYTTHTGEQRTLILGDRVNVTLNTQTRIHRQTLGAETTGIDLLEGETAIDLPTGGKAFTVIAGAGRSVATAGNFEVRYLDDKACVTCIDGSLRVEHPSGIRELQARQQMIYNRTNMSETVGIGPSAISAWRKGELVFNQTPLAQVIKEINRYRPGHVLLMNSAVARRPVSGSFAIAQPDLALAQLQRTFDLHGQRLPAGLYLLS